MIENEQLEYASFFLRLLSMLINSTIFSFITFIFILGGLFFAIESFDKFLDVLLDNESLFIFTTFVVVIFGESYFLVIYGATPGKMILKLKVLDMQTGEQLSFIQAIIRSIFWYLSYFVFGLGFVWIWIDSRNRSWHDMIAGSVVVSYNKKESVKFEPPQPKPKLRPKSARPRHHNL